MHISVRVVLITIVEKIDCLPRNVLLSKRRNFQTRIHSRTPVKFQFEVFKMAMVLIAFVVHLVIDECQSVNAPNRTHETPHRPRMKLGPSRTEVFGGNDTVFVFNTDSSKLACIERQTYGGENYSSMENGEFYYIKSTGKVFPRRQVFFHEDMEKRKIISVCEKTVSLDCLEASLPNIPITFHLCKGEHPAAFYIWYYRAPAAAKARISPENFLILRTMSAELIEKRDTKVSSKDGKKCQPGESYNEQLNECQVPHFIVDGKTIPAGDAAIELACIEKQTYSHDSYALIENGEYYYINSTGQRFHRERVYFEKDEIYDKSIWVCKQSVSLTCTHVKSRKIRLCQSAGKIRNITYVIQYTYRHLVQQVVVKVVKVDEALKRKPVEVIDILYAIEMPVEKIEEKIKHNTGFYFFVGNTTLLPSDTIFWNGNNKTVPEFDAILTRRHACIKKKTYSQDNYTLMENGEYYYINSTGKKLPRKRVFFEGDGVWNTTISVCDQMAFLTCAEVDLDNLKTYYSSEHDLENETIFMCVEVSPKKKYFIRSKSNVNRIYLSLVCLILSLVCLFLVIQTYLIFPELRNLPGKNLLSLSISLFLVQLLWLIPDQLYSPTWCHVAAIMKHYLFLVSFVAMAIIAWKTHAVFTTQEVPLQKSEMKKCEKRKFYKYSAIVWGLPAVFVVTCAVVDDKDIYAVYVNDLLCWFDNPQPHKYLFILPIGLLQLFNIIVFSLTVFGIQRTRSSTKSVRLDQQRKTMFWIYLKLSSLMGFSWLFGFIHLLVGSSTVVFSYLFVIFAPLQGVYIAVAFVMKKRIWKMYAKLLKDKPRNVSKILSGISRETRS